MLPKKCDDTLPDEITAASSKPPSVQMLEAIRAICGNCATIDLLDVMLATALDHWNGVQQGPCDF